MCQSSSRTTVSRSGSSAIALLHPDGRLRVQAGVPPDYFSRTGQLWAIRFYDYARMIDDGFSFWRRRVARRRRYSIACAWITSAALRPTGKSRARRAPPRSVAGAGAGRAAV